MGNGMHIWKPLAGSGKNGRTQTGAYEIRASAQDTSNDRPREVQNIVLALDSFPRNSRDKLISEFVQS
jgi:hypothetical protein